MSGKWERNEDGDYACSECGAIAYFDGDLWCFVLFLFCPKCGAKMTCDEDIEDACWFV